MNPTTVQELFNWCGMYMAFPDESSKTEFYAKVESLGATTADTTVTVAAPVEPIVTTNPVTGEVTHLDPFTGAVLPQQGQ